MDQVQHQKTFSDNLKATLNCYRLSSADSLGGPSGYSALAAQLWVKENKQSPPLPPAPPLIQMPLLMPKDTSSRRSETLLAGEKISCFIVGGEKRLCLPQILTTVLKDFSITEINHTCAELQIYCSRSSPDQLEILKVLGVLPFNTTQCGLITQSDAERLISSLNAENQANAKHDFLPRKTKGIQVYHECFGKGNGVFYPDLYVDPDSPCIICTDCKMKLSPSTFVTHSHRGLEKRTCHWGFDREKWRYYVHILKSLDTANKEEEKILTAMKEKFEHELAAKSETNRCSSPTLKRKIKTETNFNFGKRFKEETNQLPSYSSSFSQPPFFSQPSAFKPWGSNLSAVASSSTILHSNQDSVFLKALEPLVHAGKLLPHYFPFMPQNVVPPLVLPAPSVLPSIQSPMDQSSVEANISADWLDFTNSPKKVPNVTLDPADQLKRAEDFILMKHRLKEEALKKKHLSVQRPMGNHFWNQLHQVRGFTLKNEEILSCKPPAPPLNHRFNGKQFNLQNQFNVPNRKNLDFNKYSCNEKTSRSQLDTTSFKLSDTKEHNSSFEDDEDVDVDVVGESHSAKNFLRKTIKKKVQDSSDTVVSSEKNLNKNQDLVKTNSHTHDPSNPQSPTSEKNNCKKDEKTNSLLLSTYPIVVSLKDKEKHHKWDFPSASYVISWSGTQELTRLRNLTTSSKESKSCDLLHEVVKIVWRSEEKLSKKMKTIVDLQTELTRIKKSHEKHLKETTLTEEKLRREINQTKKDYQLQIKKVNDSFMDMSKKLSEINENAEVETDRKILNQKVIDQLHKDANESEDVFALKEQLIEERKKKLVLQKELNKLADASRTNIFAFMSNIPTNRDNAYSFYQKKNLDSSTNLDKLNYQSDEEMSINQSSPVNHRLFPRKSPSKDSGVHDV